MIDLVWKKIEGYEGLYEVSNTGVVRSLDRVMAAGGIRKGTVLKPDRYSPTKEATYLRVSLCVDGKVKRISIHRLVALHFIPNPDNKPQVNHKDSNPSNNHVSNLEWCTEAENSQHAYEHGYSRRAVEAAGRANRLLSMDEVEQIKETMAKNPSMTQAAIGKLFKRDRRLIGEILNGKTYNFT